MFKGIREIIQEIKSLIGSHTRFIEKLLTKQEEMNQRIDSLSGIVIGYAAGDTYIPMQISHHGKTVKLAVDYKTEKLISLADDSLIILEVLESGKTKKSWTLKENLSEKELEEYNANGFLVIPIKEPKSEATNQESSSLFINHN